MPKREPKKCRQWEKERRNRLNIQFNGLSKVLPSYDPSAPLSKIDILKGATNYIKELQNLKQKAISGDHSLNDDLKHDLQMLDTRIEKLLNRNEQLVALLQNAGIRIPTELKADKQFCKPKLWSNKITKEKADILAEQVNNAEKENEKIKDTKKVKLKKTKTNNENKKINKTNKKIKKTLKSKTLKVLHYNNNVVSSQNNSSQVLNVTNYSITSSAALATKSIVPYLPNSVQTQSSSIILNNPTITCKNAAVTNSTLLSTPIMATGITTDTRSISSLGPGTLILANGNVFPILPGPSPATIIQPPTLLVTNTAPATNQTLLVVGKPPQTNIIESRKSGTTTVLKQYPRIAIKRPGITKTTTVNKVPIPALTSKFGRKVIGKENHKKATNSKTSTASSTTAQNSDKSVKRKTIVSKKCDCSEKESEEPLKKVSKLSEEKEKLDDETPKEPKNDEVTEKKVPVSNYSVDSLCAKKAENEEKKSPQNENSTLKSTDENNISSPVTSFLDIPTTSAAVQTSTTESEIPVSKPQENLTITLPNHSDFSNDLFSTLHVPNGAGSHQHHPESISPTAAFLLAFPLVSTLTGGKTENADEENSESQHDPPTLLQIGNIETKQQNESQLSFDNIPNFYTVKPKKNSEDSIKSKSKLKGSTNILDTINTNTLIPEIPSFQNHIFNYEHTPVTCHKSSKSLTTPAFPTSSTSSMEVNYSEITFSNSTSTIDLQITKTSTPYISKITTTNRDQFKYPDFKNIPVTSAQKPLVNWMTTPTTIMADTSASFLSDFGNGTAAKTKYFKYIEEVGGELKNYAEEQYPWTSSSTTGVNIAPPSTLPMLMGDLALNTTSTYTLGTSKDFVPNIEDHYSKKIGNNKEQHSKSNKQQYSDNLHNNTFLSVSQLVDHSKSEQRGMKTSPRKIVAPPSLKQHRSSKNEQKSTFSEPTYLNNQNWIKQSTNTSKNLTKTEQKTYISSHVSNAQYSSQNWIAEPKKNPPKIDNFNPTRKETTFVSHVPEISYETQNWMKQSTDSKNLPKSDNYNCNTDNKELPFVSHVPNTSYGTQNWMKQSTDKNPPPKSDQKTVQSYNKESPFVSHVSNTTFDTQNWMKQSTDKNPPPKTDQKTVEGYNKESPFTSHVPNPTFETQNWMRQSTDKHLPPKTDQKTVEGYNKKSPFVSHVANTTFETQNWMKQSTDKNPPQKNDQKTVQSYSKESPFVSHILNPTFETQNWMKQSTDKNPPSKTDQKTVEGYNKESPFVSHVSNTTFETQNWMKQSTDKNPPPKTDQKTVEGYNKESPFVSHVSNPTFETQNWVKQSTDKNPPPKSDQKTIQSYNKESPFVSHVSNPTFETQNWMKQSTDKNSAPKSEPITIESYNCGSVNKESLFVSHVSNTSYGNQNWMKQCAEKNLLKSEQKTPLVSHVSNTTFETQNWLKQATNSSKNLSKNLPEISLETQNWIKHSNDSLKNETKPVEGFINCGKETTFISHIPEISYDTPHWIKQSTDSSNQKNSSKSEQKPLDRYSCGNKEPTFVRHISDTTFDNQNWVKQSTNSSNHKNLSKSEQKPVDRYNCSTKEQPTFVPHISNAPYEAQNWIKQSTDSSNNKIVYKNQPKIENKPAERYYNSQNETQNWMKTSTDSNKNVYKNCSSTYSAEALISGQSSTNYPITSKRGYVPTFDPIQPFYNNEYTTPQESTNYYPQNYQNFQNYQEFDDTYNTPSLFPSSGGISNQIKACSKIKENRKLTGNISVPCSKRTNKRKQNLIEGPPSTAGIGTSTTTLPGFSDLGFLSISSTNSPSLLPTDDPFHVPNLFNSTNNTNSSQIYSQSYSKAQHSDHLISSTYTSSCNLLPPLASSVSLASRNPVTQNIVASSTTGANVSSSSVGGNSLANFNLSTIFPEINKPVTSSGVYENSTYPAPHRAPINNNLPNLIPQQNCGNYTNLQ